MEEYAKSLLVKADGNVTEKHCFLLISRLYLLMFLESDQQTNRVIKTFCYNENIMSCHLVLLKGPPREATSLELFLLNN